jgi:LmbE family N-acetylglucosaminyl deacetylase
LKNTILVFAPHPDDEVFGCGGVMAKRIFEGYDVFVVFLTDGRNSLREIGVLSEPTPYEYKIIRKEEAKRAAKVIGLREDSLYFLDIEDNLLDKEEEIARAKIKELLRKCSPVEVYLPQEKEYHKDHRAANRLIIDSIDQLRIHPVRYEYAVAWRYPLNLLVRIRPRGVYHLVISKLLGRRIVTVDISRYLSKKKAAVEEYKSQIGLVSSNQKRPAMKKSFVERFLRREEDFFVLE